MKTKQAKKSVTPKKSIKTPVKNDIVISKYYDLYIYGILLVIMLFVLIVRMNLINIPFERDDGSYAYYGKMILAGKTPYIDFYEQKLPGIFYIYALIELIFGSTLKGLHIGFMCINFISVFFIFLIGKELYNKTTGLISASSFAFLSLLPHVSGFSIQSEHLIALFSSIGLYLIIISLKKNKLWMIFVSGIILGYSVLIKQSAIFIDIFAGIILIVFYLFQQPINWKKLIFNALSFIFGNIIIVLIFYILIVSIGSYNDMLYWVFYFATNYVGQVTINQGIDLFKYFFSVVSDGSLIFWIISLLGIILILFQKNQKFSKYFSILFFIFGFLTIFPGLRFYGHYWMQFIPAVALTIGIFFFLINFYLQKILNKSIAAIISSGIFIIIALININHWNSYYFSPNYNKILKTVYGNNPFPEIKVVGDYISKHTDQNDKIAVLGSEPQLFIYTGLESASRHHFIQFLTGDSTVFPKSKEYMLEYIHDIETKKPKYLVYVKNQLSWLTHPKCFNIIDKWFNNYSNENYQLVGLVDMIEDGKSVYVWENEIQNYKPEGKNMIGVFKLKNK